MFIGKKNLHISGLRQLKHVLFKGQLYTFSPQRPGVVYWFDITFNPLVYDK